MNVRGVLDVFDARVSRIGLHAGLLLRIGLGVTFLLSGLHQFLVPAAWHQYLAPQIASRWSVMLLPLDPVFSMFGATEILVGLLVLADWHTPTLAALSGLYLTGVIANLALAMLAGEPFGHILARDVGLAFFAFGTALVTSRRDTSPRQRNQTHAK